MDDTAGSSRETAAAVACFLDEHKAENTVLLDLTRVTTLTDYFVITTVRSSAHLGGLLKELSRFLPGIGVRPLGRHKRSTHKGWLLVDCGDFVVHLMEREEREFYDLERLWFRAERLDYSSKSS